MSVELNVMQASLELGRQLGKAQADLTTARAEIERLRGLLRSFEWVKYPGSPVESMRLCPSCQMVTDSYRLLTHATDCKLAAELKEDTDAS